jgi:hypothetical protein
MGDGGITELRIELLNTYPLPASTRVDIIEQFWDHGGYHTTLWFHRLEGAWVVLDGLVYDAGVEF